MSLNIGRAIKPWHSLSGRLILWVLVLSLLPLLLLSSLSYYFSHSGLTQAVHNELKQSSFITELYIKNWFEERFRDAENQAKIISTAELLTDLISDKAASNQPLSKYVNSESWRFNVKLSADDLLKFSQRYDYIHDLFLIDQTGNILYSIKQEEYLGTNLFDGIYRDSYFSRALKQSLAKDISIYSSLEKYQPLANKLASFIIVPLHNDLDEIIGAFVVQLNLDFIYSSLKNDLRDESSLVHYLVNTSGLLLSPLTAREEQILTVEIPTVQRALWPDNLTVDSDAALEYVGPNGQEVIGIYQLIDIGDVDWVLISEIDRDEVFSASNRLAVVALIVVLIFGAILVLIVFFKIKQITAPIIQLVDASLQMASGKMNQQLDVKSDNEIGLLVRSFNHMVSARQQYEQTLKSRTDEAKLALSKLAAQRYTIDQHSIVVETDSRGTITFANQKFINICGYSIDQLIGKNHRFLHGKDYDDWFWQKIYQHLNRGEIWQGEICNISADNQEYWLEATIVPKKEKSQLNLGVIVILSDITKRKISELALAESSRQLALVIENTEVGVWDWKIPSDEVIINERWAEISGYSLSELIPLSFLAWQQYIHPQDVVLSQQILTEHWSGKVDRYVVELRIRHKLGHWVWVLCSGRVVKRDINGKPKQMIGTYIDISESKSSEHERYQEHLNTHIKLAITNALSIHGALEQRFKGALIELLQFSWLEDSARAEIYCFDSKDHTTSLLCHYGKFKESDISNHDLIRQVIDDNQIYCDEGFVEVSANMNTHDSQPAICIVPLHNGGRTNDPALGVIYIYTDKIDAFEPQNLRLLNEAADMFSVVLTRDNARELLQEATLTAEQNSQLKSEFLASMSHEIRTPINGVLGMLGLLLNSKLNNEQQHKAILAKSSAESLLTIINDILDFSKIEAGKLELECIDFDLRTMLGEFAESIALRAQSKGIEFVLDVTQIDQSLVNGDSGRLRQILTNLVGNAIKFTERGEICIRAQVMSGQAGGLIFHCVISDTGIGIPDNKLNILFDSFTQVDASTTRKYGGTGLGLSICKQLCERMDGDISVSSELGQGSKFEFFVTLQQSEDAVSVKPVQDLSKHHFLLVDDNQACVEVLAEQFEYWGAKITLATSAKQALAICRDQGSNQFNAVFVDVEMPEMNGMEFCRELRTDPDFDQVSIVMMTPLDYGCDDNLYQQLNICGSFPKPAITIDLLNALSAIEGTSQLTTDDKNEEPNDHWQQLDYRLLLVEDNYVNQLVAVAVLEQFGLVADVANNGDEAIKTLLQHTDKTPYHLILMDCQMPIMDGYQATSKIRAGQAGELYVNVPILAMTANAMAGDREKCLDAGMDDYLTKPIEATVLFHKLQQWLPTDVDAKPYVEKKSVESLGIVKMADFDDSSNRVWDQQSALARVGNNKLVLTSLVNAFLAEMPDYIEGLFCAFNDHNDEKIKYFSHSVKGMAGNLGAMALYSLAKKMESAEIRSQQQLSVDSLVEQNALLELELLEYLAQNNVTYTVNESVNNEELMQFIKTTLQRLNDNEYINADEVEQLISACYEPELAEILTLLETQISQFDNEQAGLTLLEIAQVKSISIELT